MHDEQSLLFGNEPPWERDAASEKLVATIVIPAGFEKPLDYIVPDALADRVKAGCRVRVPLGRSDRPVEAYVVDVQTKAIDRPLKNVLDAIDDRALVAPPMLRLTRWIAEHYLCGWGAVLEGVVPAGVRSGAGERLTTLLTVDPQAAANLASYNLTKVQLEIVQKLAAHGEPLPPVQLARLAGCSSGPITALRRKGVLSAATARLRFVEIVEPTVVRDFDHPLNPDQQRALDSILSALNSARQQTILLHGVTGSGKTEVYLRAIREVVSFGRQAIVLVPEISLTPQAKERFRARFGKVAVLHSHLTDAERHWQWQRIARGESSVVVGARSAIFAPLPHLGLIVLDEEHETSFKQSTAPRYHARDVALARARDANVPLVLGSATPSLESWHSAQRGEFLLSSLPTRVLDRPLPVAGVIDLRQESSSRYSNGALSRQLQGAMREALAADGQVILLLNRRGFSTHIQCPACGEPMKCPHCDIALTHHRQHEKALCHYCSYETPAPKRCPSCSFTGIRYSGLGTQRLEMEVKTLFPDAPALRMDTDSMQGRGSHEEALAKFKSGEARILLGTQMIAKGLDFPNVTLVGVVNADVALHLPDFRAAERTFQMLVQVAGRTGRGDKGGRVLVQTFSPDHPAILAAIRHNYALFAESELATRQEMGYPPFSQMARLIVRGPKDEIAREFAAELGRRLRAAQAELGESTSRLLGPAPAPIAKLRGNFRYHVQLTAPTTAALHAIIAPAVEKLEPPEEVQWIVDVDPYEMM